MDAILHIHRDELKLSNAISTFLFSRSFFLEKNKGFSDVNAPTEMDDG